MSHSPDRTSYSVAVLVAVLVGVFALAIYTPPAANAEQFCWGSELGGIEGCRSSYRWISTARAKGAQHAVCLSVPNAAERCTSGAEAWAETSEPNSLGEAIIWHEFGTGNTHVFGEVF